MKISSIIIVGGEIESWLTAAILSKKNSNIKYTIVQTEERSQEPIGKTSATNIQFLLSFFELEESNWMKQCDATYNLGFEYYNFYQNESYFQQPFAKVSIPEDQQLKFDYFSLFDMKTLYSQTINNNDLLHFISPVSWMITRNKMSTKITDLIDVNKTQTLNSFSAYHFNSHALVDLLKKSYENYISVYKVTEPQVNLNKDGSIESISFDDLVGSKIRADLYIDCSQNSILTKHLNKKFIRAESLVNDSQIHFSVPYENESSRIKNLKNATSIVAVEYGSAKKTPLWNSCEFEYNYSSDFVSDDRLKETLTNLYGKNVNFKKVNFSQGRYEDVIQKNIFSIGNAFSVVENLSSDKFDFIIQGCIELIQNNSSTEFYIDRIDKLRINENYRHFCQRQIELLTYTYLFSKKDDNDYWKYITSDEIFDKSFECMREFSLIHSSNMLMQHQNLFTLALGYDLANPIVPLDIQSITRKKESIKSHFEYLYQGYKTFMTAYEQKIENLTDTYHFTVDHVYAQPDT